MLPPTIRFIPHIFIVILLNIFSLEPVLADNLDSSSFQIDMGTINITGGSKSSNSYKLNDTVGQTFQGPFDSAGYKVRAGFQYLSQPKPFTFVISNLSMNFGSLIPSNFHNLSHTLTVSNAPKGYVVKAVEDHPLQIRNTAYTIPNSTCDVATPCAIADANIWSSTSAYGFGYNMSGQDVDTSDFVNSNYYRPFANAALNQTPASLMSKNSYTTTSTATVNYRINISGSQAAGFYQNQIQYIAVPTF